MGISLNINIDCLDIDSPSLVFWRWENFLLEVTYMFAREKEWKPFEKKVWLASPTMHGSEIEYEKEAYDTNWMSTVGKNINEVE